MCDQSLRTVKVHESLGYIHVYGRLVGHFLGHSYTNILAPLWQAYPDLEPPQMKEGYSQPVASLSAESQAAIGAFIEHVSKALPRIKELLEFQEGSMPLPFGGFPEVENSGAQIREFLAKPRFRDEKPPL